MPKDDPRTTPRWPKADLVHRGVSRFADVVLAILAGRLIPGVGPLIAVAYLLLADGLTEGQSLGKKLGGVRVMNTRLARPARYYESILRNLPFALLGVFVMVPLVGWVLFILGGPFVVIFESYMALTDRQGLRIGDVFADTQVIDASVPIDTPEVAGARVVHARQTTPPPEPA